MARKYYDCLKCLAFCCSMYERVALTDEEIQVLADRFGVSFRTAKRRFTTVIAGDRVLRRKPDPVLGESCMFLDLEKRTCTIYESRPLTCRVYPHDTKRCVYYDVLQYERRLQGTDDVVPLIQITVFHPE